MAMIYTLIGVAVIVGLVLLAVSSVAETIRDKETLIARHRVLWEYEHIKLTRPNQIIETTEDAR